MGASQFELEPTQIFICSSQMEFILSHRTRMFPAPDTVGGVEIPTRKFSPGNYSQEGNRASDSTLFGAGGSHNRHLPTTSKGCRLRDRDRMSLLSQIPGTE